MEALDSACSSVPAIVFDLDETLIFGTPIAPRADHISVRVGRRRIYIVLRPGLKEFIDAASSLYDIYFFSFSLPQYANPIIDAIAPNTPQDHRLFREQCVTCSGYPVKDLRLLDRPLERVVIIDDLEGSALWQLEHLIRISPWQGQNVNDCVLMTQLWPLLKILANESDFRVALRHRLKSEDYKDLFPATWWGPIETKAAVPCLSGA
jgi:TFIIF-interacting CTD phosphatase-like protein